MTSIADTTRSGQEEEEDEWETVWEPADHMQELFRQQQRISDLHKGLEDADRIRDLIDPPCCVRFDG